MEQKHIELIQKSIQNNSLTDLKTLCKSGIPKELRNEIYTLLLKPKSIIKEIEMKENIENYSEIKTLFEIEEKKILNYIIQIITQKYTIALTKNNINSLSQIISILYSLKPFLNEDRQSKLGEYITILSVMDALDLFGKKGSDKNV